MCVWYVVAYVCVWYVVVVVCVWYDIHMSVGALTGHVYSEMLVESLSSLQRLDIA